METNGSKEKLIALEDEILIKTSELREYFRGAAEDDKVQKAREKTVHEYLTKIFGEGKVYSFIFLNGRIVGEYKKKLQAERATWEALKRKLFG